METRDSFGKRVGRFLTLVALVMAVTMAVVVTQRLSSDALAMLVGLGAGVLVMLPMVGLGVLVLKRENARLESARWDNQRQSGGAPPVVVVTPQALPGYSMPGLSGNNAQPASQWMPARSERQFTIVGGDAASMEAD